VEMREDIEEVVEIKRQCRERFGQAANRAMEVSHRIACSSSAASLWRSPASRRWADGGRHHPEDRIDPDEQVKSVLRRASADDIVRPGQGEQEQLEEVLRLARI